MVDAQEPPAERERVSEERTQVEADVPVESADASAGSADLPLEPADVPAEPADVPLEPAAGDLESFWVRAKTRAKLNPIEAVGGQTDVESLRPGAFVFGATREQANDLAELVLAGRKRATSSYAPAYEVDAEELPTPEDLWIMCDGDGRPRALLRNTRVECIPFVQVGEDIAAAEGEGDLAQWRADHRALFTAEGSELGYEFSEDGEVLVEYFEVLYSN